MNWWTISRSLNLRLSVSEVCSWVVYLHHMAWESCHKMLKQSAKCNTKCNRIGGKEWREWREWFTLSHWPPSRRLSGRNERKLMLMRQAEAIIGGKPWPISWRRRLGREAIGSLVTGLKELHERDERDENDERLSRGLGLRLVWLFWKWRLVPRDSISEWLLLLVLLKMTSPLRMVTSKEKNWIATNKIPVAVSARLIVFLIKTRRGGLRRNTAICRRKWCDLSNFPTG